MHSNSNIYCIFNSNARLLECVQTFYIIMFDTVRNNGSEECSFRVYSFHYCRYLVLTDRYVLFRPLTIKRIKYESVTSLWESRFEPSARIIYSRQDTRSELLARKMTTLYRRMRPLMYFCYLYGMGLCRKSSRILYVVYMSSVCVNVSVSLYTYRKVYYFMQTQMPEMFDVSTIMSVVRVNSRFLVSSLTILFMSANNAAILDCVDAIDRLDLSVRRVSLKPFVLRFVGWLTATIIADFLQLIVFLIRTEFQFFSAPVFTMLVISNAWIITPVLFYMLVVSIVRHEACDINGNVTSIGAWKVYRPKWKRLLCIAIGLTESQFGVMIIVFIIWTILEITFFCYALYLSWRMSLALEIYAYTVIMITRGSLTFQLFRECHNCKTQVTVLLPSITKVIQLLKYF